MNLGNDIRFEAGYNGVEPERGTLLEPGKLTDKLSLAVNDMANNAQETVEENPAHCLGIGLNRAFAGRMYRANRLEPAG